MTERQLLGRGHGWTAATPDQAAIAMIGPVSGASGPGRYFARY
jgi:hypothetical protein